MVWWAYNIYKVPSWYIATWKVANLWTWHTWNIWSDKEALEEEVKEILDRWVERNENEPVDDEEFRGSEELWLQLWVLNQENIEKETQKLEEKINNDKNNIPEENITNYNGELSFMERKHNEYLAEDLLERYIAEEAFHIWDWVNDEMEINIVWALESISKWENVLPYLEKLRAMWVTEIVLSRIQYLSTLMLYGNWQLVDMTDEVLMITSAFWVVRWWIRYIINRATWKVMLKLSYWEAAKEIAAIKLTKETVIDMWRYASIKMKDFKALNPSIYNWIRDKWLQLINNNGVKYRFISIDKMLKHIKWTVQNLKDKGVSHFKTKNLDEVYDLHIKAMEKVSKEVFDKK